MTLGPGAQLETYELVSLLGRGGMGEVWLARDVRLDRHVAVKLLAASLTHDPDHVARFRLEARAASSLSHPNICTIHALGTAPDGRLFIAMEYVDGTTLRRRLSAGGVTVVEAVDIGVQVASALSSAHAAGVIHRDIKPDNVMIRPDGLIKVLDFGLAKLGEAADTALTQTTVRTRAGTAIGTACYMSPEQARGEQLDVRTDLFSLGAVLYELVTSRQAFPGSSDAVIFDAVLNRTPPEPRRLNAAVPPGLDAIVTKALEKDRELRYQSASDLRADLKRLQREADTARATAPGLPTDYATARPGHRRKRLLTAVTVAVVTVIAGAAAWYGWRTVSRDVVFRERQLTSNSSEAPLWAAAISPNGKYLAYADVAGLHIQRVDTRETHVLASPADSAVNRLVWYPDGGALLVSGVSRGGVSPAVWMVSVFGGFPRKLRDEALEASISPDGSQIVFASVERREIWRMRADGSNAERVLSTPGADTVHLPGFFRNGRLGYGRLHIPQKASGTVKLEATIDSRDLQAGTSTVLLSEPGLTGGTSLADGRLIYAVVASPIFPRAASLWEARMDSISGRMAGKPRRIAAATADGAGSLSGFSASADGARVAYLKVTPETDVYVADLDAGGNFANARRLTLDDSNDFPTNWTTDGRAVLFHSDRNGTFDIFRQSLDQRTAEPMVATGEDEMGPAAVTPDGAWLLYHIQPKNWQLTTFRPLTLMRASGSGGPGQRVIDKPGPGWPSCPNIDSTGCVIAQLGANQLVFRALDPLRGEGRELVRTTVGSAPFYPSHISPDGSQVAILLAAEGRIRVLSLRGNAPAHDVVVTGRSLNTGSPFFCWSADGKGWYASSSSPEGTDIALVNQAGHLRVLRHQNVPAQSMVIPSPDGKHVAFSETTSVSNAWMLERN